jgi:HEAT repeat protein
MFMKKRTVLTFSLCMFFFLFSLLVAHAEIDQVDRLIQNLDSKYRDLRMSSIWTLGKVDDPRAFEALVSALKHEDLGVRIAAAEELGNKKDPKAIDPLITGLKENEETVGEAFAKALQKITEKDFGQDHEKWQKWWNQNKKTVLKNN